MCLHSITFLTIQSLSRYKKNIAHTKLHSLIVSKENQFDHLVMNVKGIYKAKGLDKSNNTFKMTSHGATHKKPNSLRGF